MDWLSEGVRRIQSHSKGAADGGSKVLPVVDYSSLSCSLVFGIVAQGHCVVPEVAVLLCVLTGGE